MAQQFSGAPYLNSYGVQDRYGYNGELPPDTAIEAQALNRKQQIANLLLQQGLQGAGPGQMVGRFYVPTSGMQHASKLGEILAGALGTHAIDTQRQELSTNMNAERAKAIQQYMEQTQGRQVPAHQLPQGTPAVETPSNLEDIFADKPAMPGTPQMRNAPNELSGFGASFQPAPPLHPSYGEDIVRPGDYRNNLWPSQELAEGITRRMQPQPMAYEPGAVVTPAAPATQGPVNDAQFIPPDQASSRAAVLQAMSHQDPRVREAVKFMEMQRVQDEEHKAARTFQGQQAEENRAVRREGIEANALTRVEQMKQTMALTQMQIDARMQAGQDANALKAQLADQAADLKKLELQTKRETLQQGKTPAGYRHSQDGNLEAIPGGPADTKLQGALNLDTAMLQNSNNSFDRLASTANDILNHPGLAGITGIRGKVPDVPGTDAANARALLNTLKSQVGFGVLQEMRNNSKTGGALGAVSDSEGKRLENNLAALDTTQGIDQFKKQLSEIVGYANGAKDRLRDAYHMKHKTGEPVPMQPTTKGPSAGTVEGGYRFKGGDAHKAENWEKVP